VLRLLIALTALASLVRVESATPVTPGLSTPITRRYVGKITTTDVPSAFPLGAPVVLDVTMDAAGQQLISATVTFNGVEFRTTGPTSLSSIEQDEDGPVYYSSTADVSGPLMETFVPWMMTFFFSGEALDEAQPFVFSDAYGAAIGASGMTAIPQEPLPPSSGIDLNGDGSADALLYDPADGGWSRQVSQPGGGFVEESQGSWAPGWSILPAHFNEDSRTDFFLFNTTTGQWARMLTGESGFTTHSSGGWWPGWDRYVMDLDGDHVSDVFLHDPATGVWFTCVSTPAGFSYEQGGWNPGWEVYPVRLNDDALGDLFLFSRTTGHWFWALGAVDGGFTYPANEIWFHGWMIYPGDFDGDGRSDLLLHDPATGVYVAATTGASGFAYQQGAWSLGWTPYVADLDADGNADLFLHDAASGVWFQMISDGAGHFANVGGETWSLGWTLQPADVNGDARADIVLYDPATGVWYQARNLVNGTFTYVSGTWPQGLTVIVRGPAS